MAAASPESVPTPGSYGWADGAEEFLDADSSESTVELGIEPLDADGTASVSASDTAELPPAPLPEEAERDRPPVEGWQYAGVAAPTVTQQERLQRRAEAVGTLVFSEKEADSFPKHWVDAALHEVEKSARNTNRDVYDRFGPDAHVARFFLQPSGAPGSETQEAERRKYVTHMLNQLREKPFQEVFGEITDRRGKQANDEMDALRTAVVLMRELGRGTAVSKEEMENGARTDQQKKRLMKTLAADAAARLCDSHRIQAEGINGIAAGVRDKPQPLAALEGHAARFETYTASIEMPKKLHEHLAQTQKLIVDAQASLINEQGVEGVAKQSLPPEMTMTLGDKFQRRIEEKNVPEEERKAAAQARNTLYMSLAKGVTHAGADGLNEQKPDSALLSDLIQRLGPLQRDRYVSRDDRLKIGEAVGVLRSSHEAAQAREAAEENTEEEEVFEAATVEPEHQPPTPRPPATEKITQMMQIMDDQGENPLERFGYLDAASTYGLDINNPADRRKAEKRRRYLEEVLMDDLEVHQYRQGGRWATLQAGMTSLAARVDLNGLRGLWPDKKPLQDARADAVQALRQAVTDMRNRHTPTPENPIQADRRVLTGIDIVEEVANKIEMVKDTEPKRRSWLKRLVVGR